MDAPSLTDGVVVLRAHQVDDVPLGTRWTFAVDNDGRRAGAVSLREDGDGRAEIAFDVDGPELDTESMERAGRLVARWAFDARDVHALVWRSVIGDWTSRELAWRLGFSFDGTLRGYAWVGTLLDTDDGAPRGRRLDVPVLEGDGVRLRPWRESDVPRIVEACSDPRTQAWLGTMPEPYGDSDALSWLEAQREHLADGSGAQWAVVWPADDVALASIGFFNYTPEAELEIGYWAHPEARGRGVMTRAMGLVVEYAFTGLGVRRVMAGAAVDNTASRHVIEANGLKVWGTERLGTVVRTGRADCVFYDLLLEEWQRRRVDFGPSAALGTMAQEAEG